MGKEKVHLPAKPLKRSGFIFDVDKTRRNLALSPPFF